MAEIKKRKAPTPLRLPDDWEPEIEVARARQEKKIGKPVSKHAWLLKAVRRVLDGEKVHQKNEVVRDAAPNFKGKS